MALTTIHVRTKKEILDTDGKIRPGCRILAKGEVYEIKWFTGRKDIFKDRSFIKDIKIMYTDLINQIVDRKEDRLQVFNSAGPYLPTKKIGKNNLHEAEIRRDNQLRQEWNHMVDQVLIAGGRHEDVEEFKRADVVKLVAESIRKNGNQPGLYAEIIQRAIMVLKQFLNMLMEVSEKNMEDSDKNNATDVETAVIQNKTQDKNTRPDSRDAEVRFMRIEPIHQKLNKCNRKIYALQKQQETVQDTLDTMSRSIFNRRTRRELQERIDGLHRQIESCRNQLNAITKQGGYESVKDAEAEYKAANKELDQIRRAQAEWDGTVVAVPEIKFQTQKQKVSVLKRLAEKQLETNEYHHRKNSYERGREEMDL